MSFTLILYTYLNSVQLQVHREEIEEIVTTEEILDDDVMSRASDETPKFTVTSHTVEHRRPKKKKRTMSIASSSEGNFYDLRFDRMDRHVPFPEFGVDLVHTNTSDRELFIMHTFQILIVYS